VVLDQTYGDYEIIVVNNSSQDDTKGMIASLKEVRIKVYDIKNEGVIAKSRNLGLRKSRGEYIAFLDDDDLWFPEKLEKEVDYLGKHPEYSLVYSEVWIIDENDVKKERRRVTRKVREGNLLGELIRGNYIVQLTVMMRREILGTTGFFNEDPSLRTVEDYEYWLRVAAKHRIGFIEEPLGMYRVHSKSVSKYVNDAELNRRALISLIENIPRSPDKNVVVERIYGLNLKSAIYNWRKLDRTAAGNDLKEYVCWSIKNYKLLNLFKAAFICFMLLSGGYRLLIRYPQHFRRFM
jgi:glycosyltransferase involved in cell wall biosynthesis